MIWIELDVADRESLELLTPSQAFDRGLEWMAFAVVLSQGKPFEIKVHADSVPRLLEVCAKQGCDVRQQWVNDDWILLQVAPPSS